MRRLRLLLLTLGLLLAAPSVAQGATCADHPNQASAQAAKDTRDADGDGIYCESLPCPCSGANPVVVPPTVLPPVPPPPPVVVPPVPAPAPGPTPQPKPTPPAEPKPLTDAEPRRTPKDEADPKQCRRAKRTVTINFSRAAYGNVRTHWLDAVRHGRPQVLTLNRKGAGARRTKLLADFAAEPGTNRNEYPPSYARAKVPASVEYLPAAEHRSHDAALRSKLRRWCSGQRFRVEWR